MKAAAMPLGFVADLVPGTANAADGFHTIPVGAALLGGGLEFGGGTGMHEVAEGFPSGSGIATFNGGGPPAGTPAPSYRVEHPVALSEIQKGLAPGVNVTPQAFCRTGSWFGATFGRLDVKAVTV